MQSPLKAPSASTDPQSVKVNLTTGTGMEIECNLVDDDYQPAMSNQDVLAAIADPAYQTELGAYNIEFNVPPRPLAGHTGLDLETEVRASLNAAETKASAGGAHIVMIGILPTLQKDDVNESTLSSNARYRVLNEQIFAARGEDMRIAIDGAEQLLIFCDSITPEAACTSVQLHVQVSPDGFANYWNAAQAIAGVQVALAANSPYLFGRQLWHETRITLFEQATDTRSDELKEQGVRPRVWFGERWITSVFDLFEENLRYFPALLPICEEEDPLGSVVRIGNVPLEVIGVLAAKGQSGFGQDQDDTVVIPFTTAERKVLGVSGPRGVREMRMMEMDGWKPPHTGWNAQDILEHAREIFFSEEAVKKSARRF